MAKRRFFPVVLLLAVGVSLLTPLPWITAQSVRYDEVPMIYELQDFSADVQLRNYADSCKAAQIDEVLREAYRRGAFSGQVLYAESGKVIYSECFGFSDIRAHRDSICPHSAFQLASLSKPFTAVAVMQLYQNGQLDIHQPVKTYLKDFPFNNITVKDLLQHRSGLKNYIYIADRYWPNKKRPLGNRDISPLLAQYGRTLDFTPGTRFKYCNSNYAYLALLVEEISGMTFSDYFDQNIAQPLGMTHTFVYDCQNPRRDSVVNGYSYSRRTGFYKRYPDYLDGVVGDKGLYSTAEDIFRFDQALYDPNFLADSILQLMFTPSEELTPKHNVTYGMGFRVRQDTSGYQTVFHNGWWKGFRTYFTHDYHSGRTLIWLNNRSDVTINPYIEKIFEIAGSFNGGSAGDAYAGGEDRRERELNERSETYGSDE